MTVKTSPKISAQDREILRRLAGRVAELAARPCEAVKRDLWQRHNRLERTRPLVFCDPEHGWCEIIPDSDLRCEGPLARSWELRLRREVFWGESMGDDRVTDRRFKIGYTCEESDWGMPVERTGGADGGSYTWKAPLTAYDDLSKLQYPEITVDYGATEKSLELAHAIFDGLLDVHLKGEWWWSLGMTQTLANLRGLQQIMLDVYDAPADLHRLMGFLRDATLAKLDFLEENNLLSLNNDADYVGSGGFGFTDELPSPGFKGQEVRTRDMWGFCESQETTTFSPDMFAEFIFPYQLPILDRFGLNCYGCCEPLEKRWHIVRKAPRLKRVSVAPWADRADMADKLSDRYVYSMKAHPSDLAVPRLDEERVRRELREALRITRNCRVEVIMKDNHTLGGNPDNAVRWCRIAREEAEAI